MPSSGECGCTARGGGSKAYFDEVAGQWDEMRTAFFPESVREAAYAAAGIGAGQHAVDVGAGSGFITEGLVALGVSVVAIDQSLAMLETIRKKLGDKVECRVGTAEALPLESDSMDCVFANMLLHHVEDPGAAIAEMSRVLKPGGRLVITDLDEHEHAFLRDEQFDRWMGFRRDDVSRWLQDAGLRDVSVDCANANCCSESSRGTETAAVTIFVAAGTR